MLTNNKAYSNTLNKITLHNYLNRHQFPNQQLSYLEQ